MSSSHQNTDRRASPRFSGGGLEVGLRQRGRLTRAAATVLDFNRFGIAVALREPLQHGKQIFLSLRCGEVHIENLVGVVHNCIPQPEGYRCGIQFRTRSELQFDKDQVEQTLRLLEASFGYRGEDRNAAIEPRSAAH